MAYFFTFEASGLLLYYHKAQKVYTFSPGLLNRLVFQNFKLDRMLPNPPPRLASVGPGLRCSKAAPGDAVRSGSQKALCSCLNSCQSYGPVYSCTVVIVSDTSTLSQNASRTCFGWGSVSSGTCRKDFLPARRSRRLARAMDKAHSVKSMVP